MNSATPIPIGDKPAGYPPKPGRHTLSLWLGLLGPPALWFASLCASYALVRLIQNYPSLHWLLHLDSALFLLLIAACGLLCFLEWRTVGLSWPSGSLGTAGPHRIRFLAAVGILSSLLFLTATLAQAVPSFFLNPYWD